MSFDCPPHSKGSILKRVFGSRNGRDEQARNDAQSDTTLLSRYVPSKPSEVVSYLLMASQGRNRRSSPSDPPLSRATTVSNNPVLG